MPLSSGPTLFLAPSPIEWQGRHFLKDCSPAAASCARAAPVSITVAAASAARPNPTFIPCAPPQETRHGLCYRMIRGDGQILPAICVRRQMACYRRECKDSRERRDVGEDAGGGSG